MSGNSPRQLTTFPTVRAATAPHTLKLRRLVLSVAAVMVGLTVPPPDGTMAAPGDLDPAFGNGGVALTLFPGGAAANAVVRQSDGKLVAAGRTTNAGQDFALVRYNPDGTVDTTFGQEGLVETAVSAEDDQATALVVQPDGKLVAAGTASVGGVKHIALVRYNSDGTLDGTFGSLGIVLTLIGGGDALLPATSEGRALVLQPGGELVVAGTARNFFLHDLEFALVRYQSNGALDTSFAGTGSVFTTISAGEDRVTTLVFQPDGKLVAGGYAPTIPSATPEDGLLTGFALARYNSNGTLDNSFGTGGVVTRNAFTHPLPQFLEGLLVEPDGKLVAVGTVQASSSYEPGIARYAPGGGLDTTFGGGTGKVEIPISTGFDPAVAVVRQNDGKLVIVGRSDLPAPNGTDFLLARVLSNGTLDSTFGVGGLVTSSINNFDYPNDAIIDPTGRVVVVGESASGFVIARYEAELCGNGTTDPGEDCDDGNRIDQDACKNDCTNNICGDGVSGGTNEACDDGNTNNVDSCIITDVGGPAGSNNCVRAVCGDGFRCSAATCGTAAEQCDDGNRINEDACKNDCRNNVCGDGVPSGPSEDCDDGDMFNTNGCLNTCKRNLCGDGFQWTGIEPCDDGNGNNTDMCIITNPGGEIGPTNCAAATCGDGFTCDVTGCTTGRNGQPEHCDELNAVNGDGCDVNCTFSACGNGIAAGDEQCDDGDTLNTNGCLTTCENNLCGDGHKWDGVEPCDDGNNSNNDACIITNPGGEIGAANCAAATCGDGFVCDTTGCTTGPGGQVEQCDELNTVNGDGCDVNCTFSGCGNGVTTGTEECDDGPGTNGACLVTDPGGPVQGEARQPNPNCALAECGDGYRHTGVEGCDDGNADNTDMCIITDPGGDAGPTNCVVARCRDGFICSAPGCTTGRNGQPEQCDELNDVNDDGCDVNCAFSGCGNGVAAGEEECDDGPGTNGPCLVTNVGGPVQVEAGETGPNCAWAECGDTYECTDSRCDTGPRGKREDCDRGSRNGMPGSSCSAECKQERIPSCRSRLSQWRLATPISARPVRSCYEGDACDLDEDPNTCTFEVNACLLVQSDNPDDCNPQAVQSIEFLGLEMRECWQATIADSLTGGLKALASASTPADVVGHCTNRANRGKICEVGCDGQCNSSGSNDGVCSATIVFGQLLKLSDGSFPCTQTISVTVPVGQQLKLRTQTWGYVDSNTLQLDIDRLRLKCRRAKGSTLPTPTVGPCVSSCGAALPANAAIVADPTDTITPTAVSTDVVPTNTIVAADTVTPMAVVPTPTATVAPTRRRFCLADSADDGMVNRTANTYPPGGSTTVSTTRNRIGAQRSRRSNGNFSISVLPLRFDTSSLPHDAIIIAAHLDVYVAGVANTDGRDLVGEFYPVTNWPILGAAYADTAPTADKALAVAVGTLGGGQVDSIVVDATLADQGVTRSAATGLRLHISGGQPTGRNYVDIAAEDHHSWPAPCLVIDYVRP